VVGAVAFTLACLLLAGGAVHLGSRGVKRSWEAIAWSNEEAAVMAHLREKHKDATLLEFVEKGPHYSLSMEERERWKGSMKRHPMFGADQIDPPEAFLRFVYRVKHPGEEVAARHDVIFTIVKGKAVSVALNDRDVGCSRTGKAVRLVLVFSFGDRSVSSMRQAAFGAEARTLPRFHLKGVEAGRHVSVFTIDPETGARLSLLATATVGEDGWVDLNEPLPAPPAGVLPGG
jgi:hypothetical protein